MQRKKDGRPFISSETVLVDPRLKLQEEDEESVEIVIRVKTKAPYARWKYLLEYETHFFDIFLFERKKDEL